MASRMIEVDAWKTFKVVGGGGKESRWEKTSVSDAIARGLRVRCLHCKGIVRLHEAHDEVSSPQDHAEHVSRKDSEGCIGGCYFLGVFKESGNPVV